MKPRRFSHLLPLFALAAMTALTESAAHAELSESSVSALGAARSTLPGGHAATPLSEGGVSSVLSHAKKIDVPQSSRVLPPSEGGDAGVLRATDTPQDAESTVQEPFARLGDATLVYQVSPDGCVFRFERNGCVETWSYPPESNAKKHLGCLPPESIKLSTFENILGFQGFRMDFVLGASGFTWSEFHALDGDRLRLIAESWGYPKEHGEHSVDLDGDGVPELVCNVSYEMGGHRRVFIYRNMNGRAMVCRSIDPLLPEPESIDACNGDRSERYDPATQTLHVRYLPASWNANGASNIEESMFRDVDLPIEINRLDWQPVVDEADKSEWTPFLLEFGGWEDFGSPPDPLSDVYGLGLGVFSVSANDVIGAELALGVPFAQHSVWGVQAGIVGAVAERMDGIQAGGLMSGGKQLDGISLGGLLTAVEQLNGVGLAGLFVGADSGNGIVASFGLTDTGNAIALANARTEPFTGVQLAGIANFGSDITGVQIATLFNFAGTLHGVQIGLFNRAFQGCGVQIGVLNLFGRGDDTIGLPLLNARF